MKWAVLNNENVKQRMALPIVDQSRLQQAEDFSDYILYNHSGRHSTNLEALRYHLFFISTAVT